MGIYDKLVGNATMGAELKYVNDHILDGEEIIKLVKQNYLCK